MISELSARPILVLTKPVPEWSPAEVLDEIRSNSIFSKARAVFSTAVVSQELSLGRRTPPGPIELVRMEFQAIIDVVEALGIEITYQSPDSGDMSNERS